MVNLVAKTPLAGAELPCSLGGATLSEPATADLTWVHIGKSGASAFKAHTGVSFPSANRATGKAGGRAIWFGPDQALWVGSPVTGTAEMVCVDQSDAWATLLLQGDDARNVLARLCPLDLRAQSFKRGHTARTMLGHMACSLTATGINMFEIRVFRSMAQTALHDLTRAMQQVDALRR